MIRWLKISLSAALALETFYCAAADRSLAAGQTNVLEIQSVIVNGKSMPLSSAGTVDLKPFPKNISFNFGSASNASHVPIRLRYKLDGYDSDWRQSGDQMFLAVRFYNDAGDQIDQKNFTVSGNSAGWNGDLKSSPLTHRRETLVVPAQASRLWIVISSAVGPATVGIYVVDNLIVSKLAVSNAPQVLLRSPIDSSQENFNADQLPDGWIHDGTHPSMAKIVKVGQEPAAQAFAILDDDPFSHAEWHNIMEYAPKVAPGDHLVVEWDEMFSIGRGNVGLAGYNSLPPGNYRFQVEETTAMGIPTGARASLAVLVPQPFWKKPLFFGIVFFFIVFMTIAIARYVVRQRMRQVMLYHANQRALEQERLRIAHDIHDDLGARVTQISLLSAMAHDNPEFPEKARADFDHISKMSRDLVAALYETVWAVNPENDNLDALGNYLCQMVNQLCEQTQLRCRFHIQDLPDDVQISSQVRHNITMAVKESLNNAIKHAKATEVIVRVTFENRLLAISIQDDGCGFQTGGDFTGHGLINIKRRLENIGGSCSIESSPGHGTTVSMRLTIKASG